MKTRRLGGLQVSEVGLGCNNFGGRLDAERTAQVLHAAIDHGVTFLDTADIYGGTRSEEYMGLALAGRWDQVILATKFGHKIDDNRRGARGSYVRSAVEDSLRRLRTDRIDLYQLHVPDPETPITETLEVLDQLVQEGKVREIGCSNFSVPQLREAAAAATGAKFVSVQNDYSLLQRSPETDGVLEECAATGIGFLPYFPLASGLLTGKYQPSAPAPDGARLSDPAAYARFANPVRERQVAALQEWVTAKRHTLLELAISWLLARPQVSSVISGATRPEQVAANAAAAGWQLSTDELGEIDEVLARAETGS